MLDSFLSNRPVVSEVDRVPATARESGFRPLFAAPARSDLGRNRPQPPDEGQTPRLDAPQIELVEEGGVLRRIIVTCRCCERIELECQA